MATTSGYAGRAVLSGFVSNGSVVAGIFVGGFIFGLANLSTEVGGLIGLVGGLYLARQVARRVMRKMPES